VVTDLPLVLLHFLLLSAYDFVVNSVTEKRLVLCRISALDFCLIDFNTDLLYIGCFLQCLFCDFCNEYIYTVSQKNDTDVAHYNFNAYQPILVISGRDVAERVCY